jgi:hypothetical protein
MLASMYAVVTDLAFYSGIVVGACIVAAVLRTAFGFNYSRGWRYIKGPFNIR